MENKKVFYNFVIPEDLWNMVAYYYNRYGLRKISMTCMSYVICHRKI